MQDGRFELFRSNTKFLDKNTVILEDNAILTSIDSLFQVVRLFSIPHVPGLKDVSFKTSDDVLDLIDVPQEVVVLGGIVACELAQFTNRIGSRVTLLREIKIF